MRSCVARDIAPRNALDVKRGETSEAAARQSAAKITAEAA
jgi:hypothetical protein